jgi:hypothetical protein
LAPWLDLLAHPDRAVDDAERIEQIRALEELKSAAAAAQAVVTADFVASQRAQQQADGVPDRNLGKGVAGQVALARRESAHRGSRLVGLAQALVHEMPATMAALQAGEISEWRATLVARVTACLTREDRQAADAELAGRLATLGDSETEAAARAVAYRLDPHAFTARSKGAERDRRVTLRPAPDTMSRLSGLLPVAQGVAAFAALSRQADTLKSAGDPRSRGQIMADTLVERVTGQAAAGGVPVEVELVITDTTLLAGADEPAHLVGLGPIPAPLARDLARDTDAGVWLRRLFTRPGDRALVAMESRRRHFPDPLRRFLILRDQTCRTPWCGAPIRHGDHVIPVEAGGATSAANGQGLCEACNHTKQAPRWQARPGPDGAGQTVQITTPTGHTYTSRPPPPPGQPPSAPGTRPRAPDGRSRARPSVPGAAAYPRHLTTRTPTSAAARRRLTVDLAMPPARSNPLPS